MPDRPFYYGKCVVDGKPRYTSVSQISMADPEDSGCLRKWHYDKVMGKKKPKTRATERGDGLHAEVERFEKTGDRSLSSLALSGMHFIPEPGPDLRLEHDIVCRPGQAEPQDEVAGALALARAPMDVGGVPLVGRIDLHHFRGTNKGCTSVEDQLDPPNTIEIYDWKSTGDAKWVKQQRDLPRTVQLAAYGEWAFRVYPEVRQARLSLGYFVERGGPSRKVTLRVLREDLQPTLERAAAVVRSVQHAAAESDPDRVEANTRACGAYGGCPHREYCKARMHLALESFVGRTAADRLVGAQGEDVSIIDKLKAEAAAKGQPAATVPPFAAAPMPPQPVPGSGFGGIVIPPPPARTAMATAPLQTGAPPSVAVSLPIAPQPTAEQLARLKAEEEEAQAVTRVRAAVEQLEAFAAANPTLGESMGGLAGQPLGTPAWSGPAAALYAKARGLPPGGQGYAGTGALGGAATISAEDEMHQLLKQLGDFAQQGMIAGPGSSTVVVASAQMPPPPAPPPVQVHAAPLVPQPHTTVVVSTQPPPAEQPKAEEKKAAPKKKGAKAGPGADAIVLYVDCVLEGVDAEPLQALVDKWRGELAALHGGTDILYQPKDSALAYGGWKGAMRDCALRAEIPPGAYHIRAKGSDVNEVVVEAMLARVRATGGAVIRGS